MDTKEADDNALRVARRDMWAGEAQRLAHAGKIYLHSQAIDENAHLVWRDPEMGLNFFWSGQTGEMIEVAHDALDDDTAILWRFYYMDHRPQLVVAGTSTLVHVFKMTCQRWIEAMEDAR